ncbi:zf-HC2 domain-containing protein [Acaryochloris sp. IP29b_bin.137]|uniref:anti-sigma factor family protein n=1 Tax=Acaryochloris sp. IP29b_bin.137 TaxID=2969217 RepID=UPI00260C7594|nr:zf-HC2 domain-containing protein [Acaryochloris sp. IP29b_bin.137]
MDDIKTIEFDRFELLSTYLDGEASAAERKQVEAWLASDPEFNQCYQQLQQLQRGVQALPIPASASAEQTVENVLARVERKPKLAIWATVGTAAAVAVAAISGLFSGGGSLVPQTAQRPENGMSSVAQSQPDTLQPSDLLIAIERSPVDIPVASVSDTDAP